MKTCEETAADLQNAIQIYESAKVSNSESLSGLLQCLMAHMGNEVGHSIRQIVQAELAASIAKTNELNRILGNTDCG